EEQMHPAAVQECVRHELPHVKLRQVRRPQREVPIDDTAEQVLQQEYADRRDQQDLVGGRDLIVHAPSNEDMLGAFKASSTQESKKKPAQCAGGTRGEQQESQAA